MQEFKVIVRSQAGNGVVLTPAMVANDVQESLEYNQVGWLKVIDAEVSE